VIRHPPFPSGLGFDVLPDDEIVKGAGHVNTGFPAGIRGHITYYLNPLAFPLVSLLQITPGFHPVFQKV
jgi:hypothetical protein